MALSSIFPNLTNPADLARLRSTLPAGLEQKLGFASDLWKEQHREERTVLPTGLEALDRLLAGGLPRGGLVELIGRRSSGRLSLCLGTLASVTGSGRLAAFIDLSSSLDPRVAQTAGVELERLLWLRPQRIKTALTSAEIALDSGFSLTVLDLGYPPLPGGRGSETAWVRLARTAVKHGTTILVSSPYRVSMTASCAVLEASPSRPLWHGRSSRDSSPQLLMGTDCQLELAKCHDFHISDSSARRGKKGSYRLFTAEARLAQGAPGLLGSWGSASSVQAEPVLAELPAKKLQVG